MDAAVDGVVVIDHRGLIQAFNRSAERLFGYDASEVLGRNVSILMCDADAKAHDSHLARYLNTRIPHIIGKGREVIARRKDSSQFPAWLSVGVTSDAEQPRFVGVVHDITGRVQSEESARRLQERLMHVARLATVGEMASGIAHELNQPLAAIATYAHACDRLLGGEQPDVAEVQGALRQIAVQAVRAGDIIRRLRSLTRRESTHRRPADINDVVTELTELVQSDARSHGVTYRTVLAPELPKVCIDPVQIQQVILNLVHNALEALAPGDRSVREVVVSTQLTPEHDVQLCICDTGPGVDEAIAEKMFDPFCSTKPWGTGLGLPISRTIVEAHAGSVSFRPNVPVGACFSVRLPAQTEQP